ncbi:hypothetical protein BDL97_13G114800 [Sphagnum fallax]|nr:hypothetical protein BDL97_13G114800 [Sphagnum fallax]
MENLFFLIAKFSDLKIKYGNVLRRITVEASPSSNGGPDLSYVQLEDMIRQTFKLPPPSSSSGHIVITYTDTENEVVTMTGDQDLQDACVNQGLNPLRLHVTVAPVATLFDGRFGQHQHGLHPAGATHGSSHGRHGGHYGGRPQNAPILKSFTVDDSTVKFSDPDTAKQTAEHVAHWVLEGCEPLIKNAPKVVSAIPNGGNRNNLTHALLAPFPFTQQTCSSNPMFSKPYNPVFSKPYAAPESPAPSPVTELLIPLEKVSKNKGAAAATPSAAIAQDDHEPVLHNGVQCDICNTLSLIVGPQYKSQREHELCQACFQENRCVEYYDQVDQPLFHPQHIHLPTCGGQMMQCPANPMYYGESLQAFSIWSPRHGGPGGPYHGGKPEAHCGGSMLGLGGKLDAQFVQDVTMFDGTELAPGTQFTKIWRLRNSGSSAWPPQTQLVHVGGDQLGSVYAATLKVVKKHEKFLQMVGSSDISRQELSAIQQIEAEVSNQEPVVSPETKVHANVGQPQLENGVSAPNTALSMVSPQNEEDLITFDANPEEFTEKVEYLVISQGSSTPLMVESQADDARKTQAETEIKDAGIESSELGNFSMVHIPLPYTEDSFEGLSSEREQLKAAAAEAGPVDAVLANLEAMGFTTTTNLNLDLLKKNNNDMQDTLDDLVTATEWDPMLEELEEMGFYDTEMNWQLMFKNKGSVKHVVKELVQMYKDPATNGKDQQA